MTFDMNSSLGFVLNKTALLSKANFNQRIKDYDISPEPGAVVTDISRGGEKRADAKRAFGYDL